MALHIFAAAPISKEIFSNSPVTARAIRGRVVDLENTIRAHFSQKGIDVEAQIQKIEQEIAQWTQDVRDRAPQALQRTIQEKEQLLKDKTLKHALRAQIHKTIDVFQTFQKQLSETTQTLLQQKQEAHQAIYPLKRSQSQKNILEGLQAAPFDAKGLATYQTLRDEGQRSLEKEIAVLERLTQQRVEDPKTFESWLREIANAVGEKKAKQSMRELLPLAKAVDTTVEEQNLSKDSQIQEILSLKKAATQYISLKTEIQRQFERANHSLNNHPSLQKTRALRQEFESILEKIAETKTHRVTLRRFSTVFGKDVDLTLWEKRSREQIETCRSRIRTLEEEVQIQQQFVPPSPQSSPAVAENPTVPLQEAPKSNWESFKDWFSSLFTALRLFFLCAREGAAS